VVAVKAQNGGGVPFANGTEFEAWENVWCRYCAHDHGFTEHLSCGDGCELVLAAMTDPLTLPEGWLDVPEGYGWHLPSHMVCLRFKACTTAECTGDPAPEQRVALVAKVKTAWKATP